MTAIAVTMCIVTLVCIAWASMFEATWAPPDDAVPRAYVVTDDGTGARPAPYEAAPRQIAPVRSFRVHEHQARPPVVHPPL